MKLLSEKKGTDSINNHKNNAGINEKKSLQTGREKRKKYFSQYFPPGMNKLYADIKFNIDRLQGYRKIKARFHSKVGHRLNLNEPRSFNEKIIWKKLNDRNPLLSSTADKYRVRSYIRETLGDQEAERILIPLYYVTDKPETIPFDKLPEKFVVKPNHGSQMHMIVTGENEKKQDLIINTCNSWLKTNYGLYVNEWAYRDIPRKIIIEELLQTKNGTLPEDFKFYCFHGKCRFIRVSLNRFGSDGHSAYFDLDWNMLPVYNPGYRPLETSFEKPSRLKELISLSEKLSDKFDAVRVDMYSYDDKIYFGELTHYDGSGMAGFEPESFDFEMGAYWTVSRNYWIND